MFFPIKDDVPTARTPYLTIGLIAVNTLIFLYTRILGPEAFEYYIVSYGFIPMRFFEGSNMAHVFGVSLDSPILLTPFSSMFLHGGWLHLIGNMLVLWIYGNNIEDYLGPVKFLLFYLLAGIAAVTLYSAINLDSVVPLVGASGAIAGVMGAYMVLHPKAEITVLIFFFFIQFVTLPAKIVLGIWFGMQLVMSLVGSSSGGGVAWLAHVGGFVFGYIVLRIVISIWGRGTPSGDRQRVYKVNW
jgi:membrane associated rhomboid family serine protease